MASANTSMLDSFTAFANKFYGKIIEKQSGKYYSFQVQRQYIILITDTQNVFFSPLSIYTAMGMTLIGATGTTKTELREALQIPDALTDEEVHKRISVELLKSCEGDADVDVSVANRIFLCISAKLHPEFTQTCKKMYAAGVGSVSLLISTHHTL